MTMHPPATNHAAPSARTRAALADAIMRAELAAEYGDRAGQAYADAERRAILRRIRRDAHR